VYYLSPKDSIERLLYDFNMKVGDTVKGYLESWTSPADVVKSIDTVLVGKTYRKRWYINSCYGIYIIEGIGSTYGLFELSPGCVTDMANFSLTCFRQNGNTLYPDTANCRLITSVNHPDNISEQINIFPNPSSGSFTVELTNADIKEILITSLPGNIILKEEVNKQSKITICQLLRGTYILAAIDKNGRVVKKNSKLFVTG
jgi:hypothetical protein